MDELTHLTRALASGRLVERLNALRTLSARAEPRVVIEALRVGLHDRNVAVRRVALERLARARDPDAVHLLLQALKSPHGDLAALAEEGLSAQCQRSERAYALALRALPEVSPDEHPRVIRALATHPRPDAMTVLRDALREPALRDVAARALDVLGWSPPDDGPIAERVGFNLGLGRAEAAARPGAPAVTVLLDELSERRGVEQRVGALRALEAAASSRAKGPLLHLLQHTRDAALLEATLAALAASPDVEQVFEPIRGALLEAGVPDVRPAAARALGRLRHPRASSALLQALARPLDTPLLAALEAALLQRARDHEEPVAEPLAEALRDLEARVRLAAIRVLLTLGWRPRRPRERADAAVVEGDVARCVALGEAAVEPLAAHLEHLSSTPLRLDILDALAEIGSPRAIASLHRSLGDPELFERAAQHLPGFGSLGVTALGLASRSLDEPWQRLSLVLQLVDIDSPEARTSLEHSLTDHSEIIRVAALDGLCDASRPVSDRFRVATRVLQQSRHDALRERALEVIAPLADRREALPALLSASQDATLPIALRALELLGSAGPDALPTLLARLEVSAGTRTRCVLMDALSQIDDPRAARAIIAHLDVFDRRVRERAAEALLRLPRATGVAALVAAVEGASDGLLERARALLGRVEPSPVFELTPLLEHDDPRIRLWTLESLDAIGAEPALERLLIASRKEEVPLVRDALERLLRRIGWRPEREGEGARARLLVSEGRFGDAQSLGAAAVPALAEVALSAARATAARVAALRALAALPLPEPVLEGLARCALEADEHALRTAAVYALGRRRAPTSRAALERALQDPVPGVRREAAAALGKLADPASAPALIRSLAQGTGERAVWALTELGEGATPALLEALDSSRVDRVLRGVAEAAGELALPSAVEPLSALLARGDVSTSTRAAAAAALEAIGDGRVVPEMLTLTRGGAWRSDPELHGAILSALGALGQLEVLNIVLLGLTSTVPEIRAAAVLALRRLHERSVPVAAPLERATLRGDTPWHRRAAAEALHLLELPAASDALLRAIEDPSPDVRFIAARALGERAEASPRLAQALTGDAAWRVRAAAASGLTEHDAEGIDAALIAALTDAHAEVVAAAARSLGARGVIAATSGLLTALDGAPIVSRGALAHALCAILHPVDAAELHGRLAAEADALLDALIVVLDHPDPVVGAACTEVIRALGPRAIDLLCLLGDIESVVRQRIAEALRRLGASIVEPLLGAFHEPDLDVRRASASLLGELGLRDTTPQLVMLLTDPEPEVRAEAALVIGRVGDAEAARHLSMLLADTSSVVRGAAIEALGRLGAAAVEPLVLGLRDPSAAVRREAAIALGDLRDPAVTSALCEALRGGYGSTEGIASYIVGALRRLGDADAVPALIDAGLTDDHANVRRETAAVLGKLRDGRAAEPLISLADDPDREVRKEVAVALGRVADPRAIPTLVRLSGDPDKRVRAAATRTLARPGRQRAFLERGAAASDDPELARLARRVLDGDLDGVSPLKRAARRHNLHGLYAAASLFGAS